MNHKLLRNNDFFKIFFFRKFSSGVHIASLDSGIRWMNTLLLLSRILHYWTESLDQLWGRNNCVWSDRWCHFEIMIKSFCIWCSFGCTLLDCLFQQKSLFSFTFYCPCKLHVCHNFHSFVERNYLYCYFSYKNNTTKFFQSTWVINTLRLLFYEKCGWGLKGS